MSASTRYSLVEYYPPVQCESFDLLGFRWNLFDFPRNDPSLDTVRDELTNETTRIVKVVNINVGFNHQQHESFFINVWSSVAYSAVWFKENTKKHSSNPLSIVVNAYFAARHWRRLNITVQLNNCKKKTLDKGHQRERKTLILFITRPHIGSSGGYKCRDIHIYRERQKVYFDRYFLIKFSHTFCVCYIRQCGHMRTFQNIQKRNITGKAK